MSEVSAQQVKDLREKTGAGFMACKTALAESGGDLEGAVRYLREHGLAVAAKKAGRVTTEGVIGSYIHAGGKIGVLVEVNCETDFVARTDDFQQFVRSLAMQVAAARPLYVSREEIPPAELERERAIYAVQAAQSGKPPQVVAKMVEGKVEKYAAEVCLLDQDYVKSLASLFARSLPMPLPSSARTFPSAGSCASSSEKALTKAKAMTGPPSRRGVNA